MSVKDSFLNDVLLVLLALVLVIFALTGAFTLLGWIGPVLLLAGAAYYGWREIRAEMKGRPNA